MGSVKRSARAVDPPPPPPLLPPRSRNFSEPHLRETVAYLRRGGGGGEEGLTSRTVIFRFRVIQSQRESQMFVHLH